MACRPQQMNGYTCPSHSGQGAIGHYAVNYTLADFREHSRSCQSHVPQSCQSHGPQLRAIPPSYPPGIFLPAQPVGAARSYDVNEITSSMFQSLSSLKDVQQPILYKVAGGDVKTLTNRTQTGSSIDVSREQRSANDSRPPAARKNPSALPSKQESDSQKSTDENDAFVTTDSSGSSSTHVTTLMLCNLPRKMTQESLAQLASDLGFSGMYDLVYVPKGAIHSCGYGFMNFGTSEAAKAFWVAFENASFSGGRSTKRPYAQVAKTQGLTETLAGIRKGANFRKRGKVPLLFNQSFDTSFYDLGVGNGGAFI